MTPATVEQKLFDGLDGTFEIRDSAGAIVESKRLRPFVDEYGPADHETLLVFFDPFAKGDYEAKIVVANGAPALADREQLVYAKYQLCGLELLPAYLIGALGIGSGIFGLLIGLIVLKVRGSRTSN